MLALSGGFPRLSDDMIKNKTGKLRR